MFSQRRRRITPIWQLSGPASSGGGWTPTNFGANLIAWYKADVGVTASGGNVLAWADQSGNGYNLGNSSGSHPTTGTNTLNGLNVLTFVANPQILGVSSVNFGTNQPLSCFCLFRFSSTGSNDRTIAIVNHGGAADYNNATSSAVILSNGTDNTGRGTQSDGSGYVDNQSMTAGTFYQFATIYNGTNATTYLNNSGASATAIPTTFSSSDLYIGGNAPLAVGFSGDIAEVIITNSAASPTDRANVHSYLQGRWTIG